MPNLHRIPAGTELSGADIPGLTSRDRILVESGSRWSLVIDRKSRIIMADGRRLLEKIRAVQAEFPAIQIDIRTSAPVCSKTSAFLYEQGVELGSL